PDRITPETLATSRDIGRIIEALAGDLPETQRLVFTLRDMQDLSIEEVCDITGLSSESVRSNLHYARRRLRERLALEYQVRGTTT
ncbi:RNA polymerase subunit sigma-24, partial [bacterium]|nr:RNA polymerase subunit sigma-24 [bacterium]